MSDSRLIHQDPLSKDFCQASGLSPGSHVQCVARNNAPGSRVQDANANACLVTPCIQLDLRTRTVVPLLSEALHNANTLDRQVTRRRRECSVCQPTRFGDSVPGHKVAHDNSFPSNEHLIL